jgi:drug/metabolite transporter (DMT)-like permease
VNALLPPRALLATREWWMAAALVAPVALVATLLSFAVALTAIEVSPILLLPGIASATLARFGRSLWPAAAAGDAIGQVVAADRQAILVLGAVVLQSAISLIGATWLQRADCWLRDLAQATRFTVIAGVMSLAGGLLMAPILALLGDIPTGPGAGALTGWLIMGYLSGFLVGGAVILAWGDPDEPVSTAFRQPIAMVSFVAASVTGGIGLLMEIGPPVPVALVGAIAIAGRAGARWGTATIFVLALLTIEASHLGVQPPFGGDDPGEQAANAMLAMSLFGAAVILLAGYRRSGAARQRTPGLVAGIFAGLMIVAGTTALAANEVAINVDTPYVLSGLLSLGAAIGLGVLRMSRTPASPSDRRGIVLAVTAGAVYVVNLALYLKAVPLVGSGPATGLTMTAPLWIVVLGMLAYRTRPTPGVVAGVVLIVIGAIALAMGAMGSPVGITLALGSAAVFAGSVIITKQALAHANVIDVALAASAAAAVIALAVGVLLEGTAAFDLTAAEYGALAMAALGAQLVPTLGRSWALSGTSADIVGAEGVLAPVTTTLLSFWFLDAVTTGGDIIGLVVIGAGAVVAALLGSRGTRRDASRA